MNVVLKPGQRWRVQPKPGVTYITQCDFTLVNKASFGFSDAWNIKDATDDAFGIVAYEVWWRKCVKTDPAYLMILLCDKAHD